ncbi:MAG: ATP-binding protein [Paludibacter sp.]|nr:ATP-binding protein [Paludibacter sp.]
MKLSKTNRILVIAFFISVFSGLLCEYFYYSPAAYTIPFDKFKTTLNRKEKQVNKTMLRLSDIVKSGQTDSLVNWHFQDKDISYYLYNNQLIFWSDNHLDITNIPLAPSVYFQFLQLSNAFCIMKSVQVDSTLLVAIITIKYNYPYENDKLINEFAQHFDMDKHVQITTGTNKDKYAVSDENGIYLFTLTIPEAPVLNTVIGFIGFGFHIITFLLFLMLYVRIASITHNKALSFKLFFGITSVVAAIIGICLYYNFPSLLFWDKVFTSFQYAFNPFLSSISHLSVATLFFLAANYVLYFKVKIDSKNQLTTGFILQFLFVMYFLLVYNLIGSITYHSSIQLNILQFKDLSFPALWLHFLILLWGIGLALLFFRTHVILSAGHLIKYAIIYDVFFVGLIVIVFAIFDPLNILRVSVSLFVLLFVFYLSFVLKRRKSFNNLLSSWVFVFALFFVVNSLLFNKEKNFNKYKVLAQNILINGNAETDRMADSMLEELDLQISKDARIKKIVFFPDSILAANEYLNKTYLRGFWNKYDMRFNIARSNSQLYLQYEEFAGRVGSKLKDTHFYSVSSSNNEMSYLGVFQASKSKVDSIYFFMEFYPRKNFKSYSFPNLLITSSPDIQTQLDIAIAKYDNKKLVYSSGIIDFPEKNNWIPARRAEFYNVTHNGKSYYIYHPHQNSQIVICEQLPIKFSDYLMYYLYTLLAFFAFSRLIIWLFLLFKRKGKFRVGFTAKFQYVFITLLVVSFFCIFYVSVDYIERNYKNEQIANIENKKKYIQKALQNSYYWSQNLTNINKQTLNFDLQELSYIYQTDIHVFDNQGALVGSSQPLIFNKNLIGKQISPTPFFSNQTNITQYEYIGKLNYLTAYTDFYNGDFMQIGFIAVPQFFSQDEIRNEIEGFLAVIVHIYLIIIILAIFISLFIGRQLSAPLILIENKMKKMRFGHRNEKIEYQLNDEIGQLVTQYNRTIDELERSAKLLAQSERESAWKTMARQVAHEINNPLTPMKLTIQQLQRTKKLNDDRFDDYFEKSTKTLIEQIDNLSRIAGTFSNFARMPEARFKRVDIAARLYSVIQLFERSHEEIKFEFSGNKNDVFVFADPEQLVQVFNNLLKNAIQSIPVGRDGKIQILLTQNEKEIIIEITDNGIGISENIQEKLFLPNFTTKNTGMGLGLTIAKNIIENTGGKISFTTKINQGTTFKVTFYNTE